MITPDEIELNFYEKFFIARDIEPYPVQEEALNHIFNDANILVTVPTGTGKTLIAKAAIYRAFHMGKTAIYTTPLRALTEEKFRELSEEFGESNVGFATGDYQVNPGAPIQVLVAEILWNQIYDDRNHAPADVIIMDEGHYFNEPSRGHIWEQSIIGLHPESQLIILSATIGAPQSFCQWIYTTRGIKMELVRSTERRIPLVHEYREQYLIECVRELARDGDYPAIVFCFNRKECFERARLLKSCSRFTTKAEMEEIEKIALSALSAQGLSREFLPLLKHGIGIHHAGILPQYKQLVESLTLKRLLKFIVSTETIAAGINLPAKRVIFPSLRKYIRGGPRILRPDEYHQMAGRAGRPQFDSEGIAITLAPEDIVQDFTREIKQIKKSGRHVDEVRIKKNAYSRAKAEAAKRKDVIWSEEEHQKLIEGEPAALTSQTQVTAEQILAIGLPDLKEESLVESTEENGLQNPSELEPAYLNLNIRTVIDNLLLDEAKKREAQKQLAQVTANLQAMGVLDEGGTQVKGKMIGEFRGIDGPFIYYATVNYDLDYEQSREMTEFLVDHEVIHRILLRKKEEAKRAWIRNHLRELRKNSPLTTWEDAEEAYEQKHPREFSKTEKIHHEFISNLPHPEIHGGKTQKEIWKEMEDNETGFFDFVMQHELTREEGNLFSYLSRVMKTAKMIHEVTLIEHFEVIERNIRHILGQVDQRVLKTN
ncbi:MAG: DEAD/DEAH box helicase [Myxococcota bacterium]|nr:DEAD/DEAH box helicase [Myxococcota bacterium]